MKSTEVTNVLSNHHKAQDCHMKGLNESAVLDSE